MNQRHREKAKNEECRAWDTWGIMQARWYFLKYWTTGHGDDGVGFLCISISLSTRPLGTEVTGWVSFKKGFD